MNTTVDDVRLTVPVRLINAIGDWLDRRGLHVLSLAPEKLLADVMRQTGLMDLGDDSASVKEDLERMARSYREDADLTVMGRYVAKRTVTRWLSNRLLLQREWTEHPDILQQPVTRPLFVAGLPRSGTTLMHRLLSQDPAARVPLLWELMFPVPPPDKNTRETDKRIKEAGRLIDRFSRVSPQMKSIHGLDPREPEECLWILEEFFAYVHGSVASYSDWIIEQDLTRYYRHHRKVLQLLQWRCPGDHWILKTPFHTFAMDSIVGVYPDSCIVQTHRDPAEVIASYCSLIATSHRVVSRHVDLHQIGRRAVKYWTKAVNRAMRARERFSPRHFYDVQYGDLLRDPVGVTRGIYEYFGYPFVPAHEKKIVAWLSQNPQNKHGAHRYALEQFGLDVKTVRHEFAVYIDRFALRANSGSEY